MSVNKKCPKCGSTKVQLTSHEKRHGCLMVVLFGFFYIMWVMIRWMIGFMLLLVWDWWFAIIMACCKKPYSWISKGFFVKKNYYYCNDCGYNFRA